MNHNIGSFIAKKRKEQGLTQQKLAEQLNVSFQAVSKWENGTTIPDTLLLSQLAYVLKTSVDTLLGYKTLPITEYEKKYEGQDYYWGIAPNRLCYEVMKHKPPIKPYKVLDIGCGEGKDAVFFAKNGYIVSAFDAAETGLEKARELARLHGVDINFFQADINEYELSDDYDIIFSSGVLHYLMPDRRESFFQNLKEHTKANGLHALNVFVKKPFIEDAPDSEEAELRNEPWYSGELMRYYHDWVFHTYEEDIFDCNSGGIPHKHCMNRMIAEKITKFEYWDIYDANRVLTGKTIKRGDPFGDNEYYVCCEVWIMNSKKQMLVTQRHPDKKAGGQWEFTGGGVLAGETTLLAAIREVKEELGICLNETEPELFEIYKHKNYFMDIYVVRKDLKEEEIVLDENEVIDWKWLSKNELEQFIADGKMVRSVGMRYEMFGKQLMDD